MKVLIFESSDRFQRELLSEIPDIEVATALPTPGDIDYFVFIFDSGNFEFMQHQPALWFKAHPERVIVCCLDDASYDLYLHLETKAYTWWTMDMTQAIDLIRMNAEPFVKQSELEM